MAHDSDIRIGTTVRFKYGVETVHGIVKEDRGPIGRGGRRLYLIKFNPEPLYESSIELPADLLNVARHGIRGSA